MRFRDIQHQPRALSMLRRSLRSGRVHHAYLLAGAEGVGKELTARALAARLMCESVDLAADEDACGTCVSCTLLHAGTHPDLHVVDRASRHAHPERSVRVSKGLFLTVDLIRHFVVDAASMAPARGRRRVFLIREAERMNEDAQNALLKTLEEPPGSGCLLLITSAASRLLPTIRSRSQRIDFDLLPTEFVRSSLVATGAATDDAGVLARLCDGRLGVALEWRRIGLLESLGEIDAALAERAFADPEAFAKRMIESAEALATRAEKRADAGLPPANVEDDTDADEGDESDEPRAAKREVATDKLRDALRLLLLCSAAILRDALLMQQGAAAHLAGAMGAAARALAQSAGEESLAAWIRACASCETMIDRNVQPQLALECLAAALCDASLVDA